MGKNRIYPIHYAHLLHSWVEKLVHIWLAGFQSHDLIREECQLPYGHKIRHRASSAHRESQCHWELLYIFHREQNAEISEEETEHINVKETEAKRSIWKCQCIF